MKEYVAIILRWGFWRSIRGPIAAPSDSDAGLAFHELIERDERGEVKLVGIYKRVLP